jgi:hypothetical protein
MVVFRRFRAAGRDADREAVRRGIYDSLALFAESGKRLGWMPARSSSVVFLPQILGKTALIGRFG